MCYKLPNAHQPMPNGLPAGAMVGLFPGAATAWSGVNGRRLPIAEGFSYRMSTGSGRFVHTEVLTVEVRGPNFDVQNVVGLRTHLELSTPELPHFNNSRIHHGHGDQSLHSSHNPANVLVPLNDVKYEGDLEMFACPPHRGRGR